ncbi:hypothetical protein [Flavobacterium mekongense]|uniref:hypothetical protein n=1 Tax=Flavobacterium mekongense TaxID=3379707 RepID=UPI00399BD524
MPKQITFEQFCKQKGVSAELPEITNVSEEVKKQMLATYKWEHIVKTLNNEGQEKEWKPDYDDRNQPKYEIYVYKSSGSGWSLVVVAFWYTFTFCGARRVFRTREIARYAGEKLLHFYLDTF